MGADVHLLCRSKEKGTKAVEEMKVRQTENEICHDGTRFIRPKRDLVWSSLASEGMERKGGVPVCPHLRPDVVCAGCDWQ
jgi:hypothetical protein